MSGQLSYDRSEHVGDVGAEDEVGEADLLSPPLDLFGGRRRVIRKYCERVRGAKDSRVGVGGRHERRNRVADYRHVEREFNVAVARKSRTSRVTSTRDSSGSSAKVTVSARSAASAWAFGPRTAITTGV